MKVKCILNKGKDLPQEFKQRLDYNNDYEFSLKIGHEYNVYGLSLKDNDARYLICDEDHYDPSSFPTWHPSPLFEITSNRLSSFWRYYYDKERNKPYLTFEEFSKDPYFYWNLVEGDEEAIAIFQKYKKAMDAEAYVEDEVDGAIYLLSKPIAMTDMEYGWHDECQKEMLALLQKLKSEIKKEYSFCQNPEFLNLIKTLETLGVDEGRLFGLLNQISGRLYDLKVMYE